MKTKTVCVLSTLMMAVGLTGCIHTATDNLPDHRIGVMNDPQVKGRYVAVAPKCPDWESYAGDGLNNDFYPSFGCAHQYNLAHEVANPQDLVRGREPSAADAAPGVLSIERYREDKKKQLINPRSINSTTE